jgi:hypothetical protein
MLKAQMLIVICEVVAGIGIVSYFFAPENMAISVRTSSQLSVGLPLRWCLSAGLIATAGLIGIVSLIRAYWTLAHSPYLR